MVRFVWLLSIVVGCRAAAPASNSEPQSCASRPPSYRADIEPVLREKCFACHAAGGSAVDELDLSAFGKVHDARVVLEGKVRARAMPPVGRPQLTDAERRTILSWLVCQAPEN